MVDSIHDNIVLDKFIKDILALIKPVEDDRNKRLSTIQELENCIHSLASLSGAAVKPFGSFVSDLYSKSGDLDLSVQLWNGSNHPINKRKKQNALREVRKALLSRGVTGYMQFIPHARVPVLQYVSNRFGISCDISIDNFAGRIKSRIFYWINTLDERFGDMVLLIKEWAKAQNINDPKSGSLNSYSLCLLVLFHFQTSEPPILPPLNEIYEGNIAGDVTEAALYNEQHLDEVCAANIARFRLQNKDRRNETSICRLLGTFFQKFARINAFTDNVISTYSGQIERIQDNPSWMTKSYHLFVEDPVERPDNAARAVSMKGLDRIASAFNDACHKFNSLEHIDQNELLALFTPVVGLKLGGKVITKSYPKTPQRNNQHSRTGGQVGRDRGQAPRARGFTGTRSVHKNPLANTIAHETAVQHHNHLQATTVQQTATRNPQTNTTVHQTAPYQNHTVRQVYPTWSQTAEPCQNHDQVYASRFQTGPYQSRHHQVYRAGLQPGGTYQIHNQQEYDAGIQTDGPHQNQQQRQGYTSNHQTNRHHRVYRAGLQPGGTYQIHNQQVYDAGIQTDGPHQNQQQRQVYTLNHQTNRHHQVYRAGLQPGGTYEIHTQQVYDAGFQTDGLHQNQQRRQGYTSNHQTNRHHQAYIAGLQPGGTYEIHSQQVYDAGFQTDGPHQNQQRRKGYTSNHQTNRHAATATRYEPVRGQFNNETWDSRSQAPGGAASQR